MKRSLLTGVGSLLLALGTLPHAAQAGQVYNNSYCREYTQNFTVGNEHQQGYGTACLQPDGSWRIQPEQAEPVIVEQNTVRYVTPPQRNIVILSTPRVRYTDYPRFNRDRRRHYFREYDSRDYGHYHSYRY